jgi:nitrate reductase gamma subunit
MATTRNDKVMYVLLVGAIVLGLWTTLVAVGAGSEAHNYRETVSPWFRSVFRLNPDVDAMAEAPIQFHVHVLVGMLLFAAWPFTRLVHAFTAPVHYLFRPYIVYRSRDARTPAPTGRPRAGWSPVGTTDRERNPR